MSRTLFTARGRVLAAVTLVVIMGFTAAAGFMQTVPRAAAQGNACVAVCKSSHNQCRIATKGNPSCDAELQSCLQACLRK